MSPSATLVELAKAILKEAEVLNAHLESENLPQPSFDINGPGRVSFIEPNAAGSHERLLAATSELHHLALGPAASLMSLVAFNNAVALSVINRFRIAHHVPLRGQMSYEHLAELSGVPLSDLKRILRQAMSNFVFCEPTPGKVAHTAASRLLAENRLVQGAINLRCDESFPAASKVADSIENYPDAQEPTLSGWGLANNAQLPLFDELAARHPRRASNFANAMEAMARAVPGDSAVHCLDWASLGTATVVDLGGAKGPVSIALARAFPDLSLIVQDLAEVVADGRARLPADVQDRVTFMAHDFFLEQPVKNADVYYCRACFHNWPDKYCVRILQNLIPALKKGAKVVIQDHILSPKSTVSQWRERQQIDADIGMMIFFTSHNREKGEWESLLAQADRRFRFVGAKEFFGKTPSTSSDLCAIEAVWEG